MSKMTLLEFLDRIGERRAQRPPRPPRDIRQFIGFAFLGGYYFVLYRLLGQTIPKDNADLIRDAMLTLGPPIGIIIGAMFRSDARQDQQAVNTGEAFKAIREVGKAVQAGTNGGPKPDVTLKPGETAQAEGSGSEPFRPGEVGS